MDKEITIKQLPWGSYTGDTIHDQSLLCSIVNKRFFKESEYDHVLSEVSKWGYHFKEFI